MSEKTVVDSKFFLMRRTQYAFICTRLLSTPCWCLLSILTFILYKNMHLAAWEIAVIVALKPASSLLSPYWSQAIYQRSDKIGPNLFAANLFRHFPFLLIPWIDSAWFIIFSFGCYMTLTRATIPAWMELFKYNLPKLKREELVAYGTMIDYLGAAICSIGVGFLLDHFQDAWRWFFFITALLGILSTFFLTRLPLVTSSMIAVPIKKTPFSIRDKMVKPWQQVWQVLTQNRGFVMFHIGFMLGGGGLMIMQPALPKFFIDTLQLSFTEMSLAISLCKGVGVALTSSLWTRLFRRMTLFHLCALVTFFATLFPFFLLATSWHHLLFYIAYGLYGIMQAGSELGWHMSALIFAQEKDSTTFSVTNVLTVGIRGCVIPVLGSLLLPVIGPLGVILLGALLCLSASGYFFSLGSSCPLRN